MATKLDAEWGQDETHQGMRVTFGFSGHSKPRDHVA
jgi:hypothetical protein